MLEALGLWLVLGLGLWLKPGLELELGLGFGLGFELGFGLGLGLERRFPLCPRSSELWCADLASRYFDLARFSTCLYSFSSMFSDCTFALAL